MRFLRTALLGACTALPHAAPSLASASGAVLVDAVDRPIAVLTPNTSASPAVAARLFQASAAASTASPMLGMIAGGESAIRAMMDRMEALVVAPKVATDVARQGEVDGMVVSTISIGSRGACSETIRYSGGRSGAPPHVTIIRVGDACGGTAAPPASARALQEAARSQTLQAG